MFHYLDQHPRISGSRDKEPSFFSDLKWSKGIGWYRRQFRSDDTVKFEASTVYSKFPEHANIAGRIARVLPDVKLIYVIRHPVDRLISQIIHNLRMGNVSEDQVKNMDFEDGAMVHYLNCSRYYLQVSQYLEYFDQSQILIITSEELKSNRLVTINRVLDFLNVAPLYESDSVFAQEYNIASPGRRIGAKPLYRGVWKLNRMGLIPPWHKLLEVPLVVPVGLKDKEFRQRIWDEVVDDLMMLQKIMRIDLHYTRPE